MTERMVCKKCKVVVSKRSYPQHINRKRCGAQHMKKDKLEAVIGRKKKNA